MRILLIEDDRETAYYISHGLSGGGRQIAIARDGRDALHRALSEPWDLLIVDRMLPELDGLSLVLELRVHSIDTPVTWGSILKPKGASALMTTVFLVVTCALFAGHRIFTPLEF
jgi:CheY-like chemotaxis protein